jgi:hypothetical protein
MATTSDFARLDSLAREVCASTRRRAGIPTMPSFTTLLSGVHPLRHGITAHASSQRVSPICAWRRSFQGTGLRHGCRRQPRDAGARARKLVARGFDFYSSFLYALHGAVRELCDRAISFFEQLREQAFFV